MKAPIRVREAGLTLAEFADSGDRSGATAPVLNRLPRPATKSETIGPATLLASDSLFRQWVI
jgi:hypothetical protein